MSIARLVVFIALAMLAFAGNSLLCRLALKSNSIDPASFTTIRLISGALVLWLIVTIRFNKQSAGGNWTSGFALFVYAAAFSFAYIGLTAASGALLLFGAVQATMLCFGLFKGERFKPVQLFGLLLAFSGLVGLLLPGLSAPPIDAAILMLTAGVAWGVYSLRGKGSTDSMATNPTKVTAGNFLRAVPFAVILSVVMLQGAALSSTGVLYAIASGAVASGLGYAIWYAALPAIKATSAATIQLSVPVITALGGIIFLGEALTLRLTLASIAILGGVALVIFENRRKMQQ